MRRRALAAALLLGLAGCDDGRQASHPGGRTPTTPAAAPTATAVPAGAVKTLATVSYRYELKSPTGMRETGIDDPVGKTTEATITQPSVPTIVVRQIGTEVYVKGLPWGPKDKWLHYPNAEPGQARVTFADGLPGPDTIAGQPASTMTLDGNGRLSRLVAGGVEVTYTDYGTKVTLARPAARDIGTPTITMTPK